MGAQRFQWWKTRCHVNNQDDAQRVAIRFELLRCPTITWTERLTCSAESTNPLTVVVKRIQSDILISFSSHSHLILILHRMFLFVTPGLFSPFLDHVGL
jgi:hypothetical protein